MLTPSKSISVFSDIGKFADFRWKNAYVSRTSGVCQVIHIFFGSSLGITLSTFINVGYVWEILGRRAGWGGLFAPPPSVSSPEKAHLNKLKLTSPRKKAPLFLVQLCILVLKTINSKRIEYVVHYVNRVIQVTNVQLFLIFKHVRKF